ncbi:MAG TPA: HAD family hydrolase [Candidatus Korarchaeota archaeon]|nr:HAD family hydrolase [Candidatus Korarchaeota archaeon]
MAGSVLIDMWGTIIEPFKPIEAFRRARVKGLLEASGVRPSEEELERFVEIFSDYWARTNWKRVTTLEEVPAERDIAEFLAELGLEPVVTDRHLVAYSRPYVEFTRPRDGVREALEELSQEFRLAVVSNVTYGPMVVESLERHGLIDYFEAVVTSYEVGLRKPHPKIFKRALEALEARASEAVMVGDELVDDVIGARASGIKAILLGEPGRDHGAADAVVSDFRSLPRAVRAILG